MITTNLNAAQKTAVILVTIIIGIAIVIFSFIANGQYQKHLPAFPKLEEGIPEDTLKSKIAIYNAYADAADKRATFLYELVVGNVLAPLFKTLIGGIVGFVFLLPLINSFADYIRVRSTSKPSQLIQEKK